MYKLNDYTSSSFNRVRKTLGKCSNDDREIKMFYVLNETPCQIDSK